jgi:hypothetical protein
VRCQQHQLEPVWNLVDAIFDCHACHAMIPLAAFCQTTGDPNRALGATRLS